MFIAHDVYLSAVANLKTEPAAAICFFNM